MICPPHFPPILAHGQFPQASEARAPSLSCKAGVKMKVVTGSGRNVAVVCVCVCACECAYVSVRVLLTEMRMRTFLITVFSPCITVHSPSECHSLSLGPVCTLQGPVLSLENSPWAKRLVVHLCLADDSLPSVSGCWRFWGNIFFKR